VDDGRTYTLEEHRALPKGTRPVWTIGPVRFVDTMRAGAYCRQELDRLVDEDGTVRAEEDKGVRHMVWLAARAASQIRTVKNADRHKRLRGGPPALAADRMRWMMRLPPEWISELSRVAAEDGDLDQEEE